MELQVLLLPGEINTATERYVDIVVTALTPVFSRIVFVDNINDIDAKKWTFAITHRCFFALWKARKAKNVIYWFQGVEPEELDFCTEVHNLRHKLRIKYYEFIEKLILRKAKLILFVSKAMREHYRLKYGYKKTNNAVMPCVNQDIDENAFYIEGKYEKPTFVYAGGLHPWQCVRQSMVLFSKIKEKIPSASLTLLTGEKEKARQWAKELNLDDVMIKFVPLKDLDEELSKYKYGFMLRDDIIVNNVATPTKFNSYLALGIIPIVTDVVHDFRSVIDGSSYIVKIETPRAIDEGVVKIIDMEKGKINPDIIKEDFIQIFRSYYNIEGYSAEIKEAFSRINSIKC